MSRIIRMEGIRPDGIAIRFNEADVDKIRGEQFVKIEIVEHLTESECLERYGKIPKNIGEKT